MKVCTDACLFGGWLAKKEVILNASSILDIGTGTGLLSLMLAQAKYKNDKTESINPQPISIFSKITAIEIEIDAAKQAAENVLASPWRDQINIHPISLQAFTLKQIDSNAELFDVIVTNPPFFEGDLISPNEKINVASHSTALPWVILVKRVASLLKDQGFYFVLIPSVRAYTMQKLCALQGLQLIEEITVLNKQGQLPFRSFLQFKKMEANSKAPIVRSNIIIKETNNEYTPAFIELLKDYYLHL